MDRSPNISDVAPLADCNQLEGVVLPSQCTGIESLRALPNLKRIGYEWKPGGWTQVPTAAEFWKEYDAKRAAHQ